MTVADLLSARSGTLRGGHVLAIATAFFAVVFLANAAMIYSALSTNTGGVGSEPYRKGLYYNERIAADARQARLHWTQTLSVTRDGRVGFTLVTPEGRPVVGLHIAGTLGRPSTARHDVNLVLSEAAPGRYEALVDPLAAGSWLIVLNAWRDADDPIYRIRKRLWLTP